MADDYKPIDDYKSIDGYKRAFHSIPAGKYQALYQQEWPPDDRKADGLLGAISRLDAAQCDELVYFFTRAVDRSREASRHRLAAAIGAGRDLRGFGPSPLQAAFAEAGPVPRRPTAEEVVVGVVRELAACTRWADVGNRILDGLRRLEYSAAAYFEGLGRFHASDGVAGWFFDAPSRYPTPSGAGCQEDWRCLWGMVRVHMLRSSDFPGASGAAAPAVGGHAVDKVVVDDELCVSRYRDVKASMEAIEAITAARRADPGKILVLPDTGLSFGIDFVRPEADYTASFAVSPRVVAAEDLAAPAARDGAFSFAVPDGTDAARLEADYTALVAAHRADPGEGQAPPHAGLSGMRGVAWSDFYQWSLLGKAAGLVDVAAHPTYVGEAVELDGDGMVADYRRKSARTDDETGPVAFPAGFDHKRAALEALGCTFAAGTVAFPDGWTARVHGRGVSAHDRSGAERILVRSGHATLDDVVSTYDAGPML